MKTGMIKKVITLVAAFAGTLGAFATDVTSDSVVASTGTLAANGNNWTASALTYLAPTSNDDYNRSETGWYAGIKRTWALSYSGSILNRKYTGTKASDTKASSSDNAGRLVDEYSVFLVVDLSPSGSGIKNAFQLGGLTTYMKTTDWNVWVTPETMHALAQEGKDYEATLTIGGETYTITVPQTVVLKDNDNVQWYPAIAVVDGKVYGDMAKAVAAAIQAAMDGKEMEFYEVPTGYPANVSAQKVGDVWKLVVNEPMSISDATIALSATEIIVRDADIVVEMGNVTFGEATLVLGEDYTIDESSVFQAKEIGEYTVTINGIGNYTGSASTTWKIVEPTGEFAEDAMSMKKGDPAYGSIATETPRRLDITDTTKLVYRNDELGERWEAAVVIRWPHEVTSRSILQAATSVRYTDAEHATVAYSDDAVAYGDEILEGAVDGLSATTGNASYYVGLIKHNYEYFDTLTWTVPIYAEDVADAIENGAKHLEFSIKCGSVAWGDETEGNVYGLKETEFTVDLRLANVFLLDNEGNQVYPHHDHDWHYALSEDGTTLTAKCAADGCFLSQTTGDLSIAIESKDAKNPDYAEGHYRDGKPSEATLKGADSFALTGAAIGEVEYETEGGEALEGAPVEPGRYVAYAVITSDGSQGEEGSWTIRVGGLEILAGEAVMDGIHVKDAATYLEKATGDAMEISAGKSYTAAKTYVVPAKHGLLNLSCGTKTYDLAGFAVTAAVDSPFFENNGKLVIRDTSESGEGAISANQTSADDVIIVNTGSLSIEGGTFVGSIVNDGGTVALSGGRYSVKPDASFVSDGYDVIKRGGYWCVEKHEHKYIVHSLANHLLVANCMNVLADGTLQVSHCSGRMLVGVVGIRKLGLIPQLSVDYDRKEHPAEFYAINLSGVAELLQADGLLDSVKAIIESDPTNLDAAGLLELLTTLSQNANFADVLGKVGNVFVTESEFEKMTGATISEISYSVDGEPVEGEPVEAGLYTASVTVDTAMGTTWTLKGTYRINEKELPIETEGHSTHVWTFTADGAKITATCPGVSLLGQTIVECKASPMALELVPSVEGGCKVYDAKPLEVTVSNLNTFVINTDATVGDIVYLASDGTELGSAPVEPGEYTAKVEMTRAALLGLLEVKRTATLPLVIEEKKPTGQFPVSGWTKHVGAGSDALVVEGDALYYPVELDWPHMIEQVMLTPRFTDPAHAEVRISTVRRIFTGEQLLEGEGAEWGLAADAGEFFRIKKFRNQSYMKGVTWLVPFTFAEIDEARTAGETEIVRTITLEGKCCEDDMEGLAPTTYTIILDVENLVINDSEGRQIYPVHNHSWTVENTGSTLTLTCDVEDCPQAPGLVADLSVGFESKTYDTLPAKATLTGTDAMRIHADVEFGEVAYVELGEEGAEYPLGANAPSVPGSYRVEVEYSNGVDIIGTLAAEFKILPLDASGICAYFDDPRIVFVYTGETQGPDLSSVWYGIVPLRYGVDFIIEGDLRATDVGEYLFAIVGTGNFEGRREFKWRIVEPSRPFEPCALKIPGGMCSPQWGVIGCDGKTAYVVNSSNLIYNAAEDRWTAPLTIDWPENIDGLLVTPAVYTDPCHAKVETDCGEVFLVTSFFKRPLALCPEEYVVKVLWLPSFTMDDVVAAFDNGQDELVFEITVGSNAWACDPFGLKATTFRLVVPIKGLVHDDEPIDWYWIEYLGKGATSGEMEIERRLTSETKRLTDCAYKNTGLNMLGWSFDEKAESLADIDFADRQFVLDEFEVGVTNTIYAIWTTNVVISGDIEGDQYKDITSISVWGVGSTIDDAIEGRVFGKQSPWRYVAEVQAQGAYDIAATSENADGSVSTTTALVIATPDPEEGPKEETKIEESSGDISSTVDNTEAGAFPAVVGGLPKIAEKAAETEAVGTTVEVCFSVKEMPSADTTVGYANITNAYPAGHAKPLDFTLGKYVNGVLVGKLHDLTAYNGLVQVIVPFNKEGRRNLKVVRYHEDVEGDPSSGHVDLLPEGVANANADGECFEFDETSNELQVRGAKLSTYALLWDGAEVSHKSLVWHVDWLSGMYVPEIELEVKPGDGWANSVSNMSFMLEKRDGIRLWDAKSNAEVTDIVNIGGVDFYKVSLKDRFGDNNVAGADSDTWGVAWFDATWVNAALSEVLLYAPQYWPANPKDVPTIDSLIAYVSYESYDCNGRVTVGANKSLVKALSAVAPKMLSAAPASVADLNASLAVGAPVAGDSDPYCKIVGFTVEDGILNGTVEVGAGDVKGSVGYNASVVVMGAKSLSEGFNKIKVVECDAEGNFSVEVSDDYKFFKVALSVSESVK